MDKEQHTRPSETEGARNCHYCGAQNPKGQTNCSGCGTALELSSEHPDHQNKKMAIASLVLGIGSLTFIGSLAGFPAVVLGHIAHRKSVESPERFGGRGYAVWGLATGYLGIAMTVIVLAVLLPKFAANREKARALVCRHHLKTIATAVEFWALDRDGFYCFNVSTNDGGTKELCQRGPDGWDSNAVAHFRVMAQTTAKPNLLKNPAVLVCPSDHSRKPASSPESLTPENISYLLRTAEDMDLNHLGRLLLSCPIHDHIEVTAAGL